MTAPDKITISRDCAGYFMSWSIPPRLTVADRDTYDRFRRELEAALSSPAPTDRAQAYVVLVTNNDGGHPAIIMSSIEQAREWAKDYLKDVGADELTKLSIEIDAIDGKFVQSVHTSDAWKESIYIAPMANEPRPSDRAQAIEECAKIADEMKDIYIGHAHIASQTMAHEVCENIAGQIRALLTTSQPTEEEAPITKEAVEQIQARADVTLGCDTYVPIEEEGWVKINADHPLPDDLKVGDWISVKIEDVRLVPASSPLYYSEGGWLNDDAVAYRRASGER